MQIIFKKNLKFIFNIKSIIKLTKFSVVEFIPRNLPSNITLIVTCRSSSDDVISQIIDEETWYKINLTHFSNQLTEKYIKGYLGRYNKAQF